MLLLALVWAAIHPAVVNAAPAGVQKVMVCTAQGMVWVDARELEFTPLADAFEPSSASASAIAPAPVLASGDDDAQGAWVWLCPWCQFACALELAPAQAGGWLDVYLPYLAYVLPQRVTSARARPDVLALWPPTRGPPVFFS